MVENIRWREGEKKNEVKEENDDEKEEENEVKGAK